MCLITNQNYSKKAEADIVCYKVVMYEKGFKDNEQWLSPIKKESIEKNVIEGHIPYIASGDDEILIRFIYKGNAKDIKYMVGCGYIHTYKDKETAAIKLLSYDHGITYGPKLFKCIIPKDTEYFDGTTETYNGYASKCIKFIEEIEV